MFAGNFAPRGWALCNGQVLSIAQNTALFSLLGTTYGGNGTSNFQLPDLQGRLPLGQGNGPGLSPYVLGEMTGAESVTLTPANLPAHTHALLADAATVGTPTESPAGNALAATQRNETPIYTSATPTVALDPRSVGETGGSLPLSTFQPAVALNFIIALQGIFPSRN
jgi:microcystin-dependent protein